MASLGTKATVKGSLRSAAEMFTPTVMPKAAEPRLADPLRDEMERAGMIAAAAAKAYAEASAKLQERKEKGAALKAALDAASAYRKVLEDRQPGKIAELATLDKHAKDNCARNTAANEHAIAASQLEYEVQHLPRWIDEARRDEADKKAAYELHLKSK